MNWGSIFIINLSEDMILTLVRYLCKTVILVLLVSTVTLWYLYQQTNSGTIYLPNAPGTASITREEETGIAHIKAVTEEAALYAQGFAHA